MENINGYDISPDMVRIGLANMYLHGFPEPNVVEYDALTSEDRWNEYYDVILVNPPFMTPKEVSDHTINLEINQAKQKCCLLTIFLLT